MAIQQPISTDPLNSPDHSLSHRVFANDSSAPVQSIVVNASGNVSLDDGTLTTTGYISSDNFTKTSHYTGFPNRTATSLGWNDGSYTLTLTATSDPIWINGVSYVIDTLTKQITDTTGLWWFWITAPGGVPQLNASTDALDIGSAGANAGFDQCLVASVYWNTTTDKGILSDERHWMGRDCWMHEYLHETVGARWYSGGTLTFPTASTFELTECEMYDEDLESVLSLATTCKILYKNGSANWEWDTGNTTLKKVVTGAEKYNDGNTLTSVSTVNHFATWVFATNNVSEPFVVIIGQREDVTLANARANNTPNSLSLGTLPSAEMKLLYRVLWKQGTTAALEIADYRSVSNIPVANYTATDHSTLSNLTASTSGHTGFVLNPTVTALGDKTGGVDIDLTGVGHGSIYTLTLDDDIVLQNPTNATNGFAYTFYLKQNGTGGNLITLGNKFKVPSSATTPLGWSTAANAMDILAVRYDSTADLFYVVSLIPGY